MKLGFVEPLFIWEFLPSMPGEGDESILGLIEAVEREETPAFLGVAYLREGKLVHAGERKLPETFETIPDRELIYRYKEMAGHNTVCGQVHSERGNSLEETKTHRFCGGNHAVRSGIGSLLCWVDGVCGCHGC